MLLQKLINLIRSNRWLVIIMGLTMLVRIPSLFEPLWYEDEAIYMIIGREIRHGATLYVDIFDHKTPGIYYFAALITKFFGENILTWRILLNLWVLATLPLFYFLAKKLTADKKTALWATGFFGLLTATPLLQGNVGNSEIFVIPIVMLAVIAGLNKKYFLSGLIFSLTILFKVPFVFDFGAFFLFTALSVQKNKTRETLKNLVLLTSGVALPVLLSVVYFAAHGALNAYIQSALLFNVTYTTFGNSFLFPHSLMIIKGLPILTLVGYLVNKAFKNFQKSGQTKIEAFDFVLLWAAFSFYAAIFGGRAYFHYLIEAVPAFAILAAYALRDTAKRKIALIVCGAIVIGAAVIVQPIIYARYYPSFFRYITGKDSFMKYTDNLEKMVAANYQAADYLRSNTQKSDTVFAFSNQPGVYLLSGLKPATPYILFSHIENNTVELVKTVKTLTKTKPKFILVQEPEVGYFPQLFELLKKDYHLVKTFPRYKIYQIN